MPARVSPKTLAELAKCYRCIPEGMTLAVWIYLLCQWANGGFIPPNLKDYLTDDQGNYILDDQGNKIVIQL